MPQIRRPLAALLLIGGCTYAAASDRVCFYADYDYRGISYCPTGPEGDITGDITDKISAVHVPPGLSVTVFQHPGFGGKNLVLEGDTPNLSNLGFNNLASSYRIAADGPQPVPTPTTGQTCFFQDYNYQGASFCTQAQSGDIVDAGVAGKVSSVRMQRDGALLLFDGPGLTGRRLELTSDTPNLSNLAFNNVASSFAIGDVAIPTAPSPTTAIRMLMVGNSFTHGNFEPTLHFNAGHVTDLNGSGMGGVPGIFKQLTADAGLDYDVSIEAVSGQSLEFHYQNRLTQIGSKAWDVVVLQEYSTLDPNAPLNPGKFLTYSALLERHVHASGPHPNPEARVLVLENWPRADQLYQPGGVFFGQTAEQAGLVLHNDYALALAQDPQLAGILPVGDAFVAAISAGAALRNPYVENGNGPDLWNVDYYHASTFGSYLEALVVFGQVTGLDPRSLGAQNPTGQALGLPTAQITEAEDIAAGQVAH